MFNYIATFLLGAFFGVSIIGLNINTDSITFISDKPYYTEKIDDNTFKLIEKDNSSKSSIKYKNLSISFKKY